MAPDIESRTVAIGLDAIEGTVSGSVSTGEIDIDYRSGTRELHRETSPEPPRRRDPAPVKPRSTTSTTVTSQYRKVAINGNAIDADVDIHVSAPETGYPILDLTLWNLRPETWADISGQDDIDIYLGWRDGPVERILAGRVVTKRKRHRGEDDAFVVRGRDRSADALHDTLTRSYSNLSPHRIVEHLVDNVDGLTRGFISTESERIDGNYSITHSRELRDWFDKLAERATRQTGTRWIWHVQTNELHFHPVTERTTDVIGLDAANSMTECNPVGRASRPDVPDPHEAHCRLEPTIRRGMAVQFRNVNTLQPEHRLRVTDYVFESSSTNGTHHTRFTAAPLTTDAENEVNAHAR